MNSAGFKIIVIFMIIFLNLQCSNKKTFSNKNESQPHIDHGLIFKHCLIHLWWSGDEDSFFPEVIYYTGNWENLKTYDHIFDAKITEKEMKKILYVLSPYIQGDYPDVKESKYLIKITSGFHDYYSFFSINKKFIMILELLQEVVQDDRRKGFRDISFQINYLIENEKVKPER